ncbi:HD domain-containing phosphohydrolase [Nitrospirota bacterium]
MSIRLKISLVILFLVALITLVSSVILMRMMEKYTLETLLNKGVSIGRSVATVAGYHMLSGDRLALDNLTSTIAGYQDDVLYVAAVDRGGVVRAHSTVELTGKIFSSIEGEPVRTMEEGTTVSRVLGGGMGRFEFEVPVMFMDRRVGSIHLAIDSAPLVFAQQSAKYRITIVAVTIMALGTIGAFFLSVFFTRPIKKLSDGVIGLSSEDYSDTIPVSSGDELGQLTEKFNEMAYVITSQRGKLKKRAEKIEESYVATLKLLSAVIDARDKYTLGHSNRVSRLSTSLGKNLGLDKMELRDLEVAAMFHDVGKIRTPDSILKKTGPLNKGELIQMMTHTKDGANILSIVDSLHKYIPTALHHHEWYDGSGYPEGLKGDEIHPHASIVAIADAFDAMTSSRPYRPAMPMDAALEQIRKYKGVQFAPHIVDPFLEILESYEAPARPHRIFA